MTREYDVVLFGATGFTGALTARYLAAHAPAGLRWALAGRSRVKLGRLRDDLGVAGVDILDADVSDRGSLRRLAAATRVVATTVGPYVRYGEPLVAACAEAGTDYADLAGEAEFVDRMYLGYHDMAVRTGARLVHACGFDSIPHDLGALFTVAQFPSDQAIRLRGYVRAVGSISGGTFASAVTAMARSRSASVAHRERHRAEQATGSITDRVARGIGGRPGFDRSVGSWVLPLPTIDPQIVLRSARALDVYGPDFQYSHFMSLHSPLTAVILVAGAGAVFGLAKLPPTRALLLKTRPAGSGPTPRQRERSWFTVRFIADSPTGRVVTEVSGGDPGYGETAKMLGESVLCLASDELPETAGQVTTAVALGDALRVRLERADITFRVLSST